MQEITRVELFAMACMFVVGCMAVKASLGQWFRNFSSDISYATIGHESDLITLAFFGGVVITFLGLVALSAVPAGLLALFFWAT